jgi:serine/threonine protein kinase
MIAGSTIGVYIKATNVSVRGNVIFKNTIGVEIEMSGAIIERNVLHSNSEWAIENLVPQTANWYLNNSIYANQNGGITLGNMNLKVNAPLLNYVDIGSLVFGLFVPGNISSFSIELYGNPPADMVSFNQGKYLLMQQLVTVDSSPADRQISMELTDLPLNISHVGFVTAIVTFETYGSTGFSNALAVVSDKRACNVCACYNKTVDCRAKLINFIPTEIPSDTEVLDLSQNPISFAPSEAFRSLTELQHLHVLNVSRAGLVSLDWLNNTSLETLVASDNMLSQLPELNMRVPTLQTLQLQNNPTLKRLSTDSLSNLINLVDLSLENCGLTGLNASVFDQLPSLLTLNLAGNTFANLNTATLSAKLRKLSFLSVAKTQISSNNVDVSNLDGLQALVWSNLDCPSGFFGVGDALCLRCPDGTFKPAGPEGRPACVQCAAGSSDTDLKPRTPCETCPAGAYAAVGSSGPCQQCPVGTTDDDNESSTPCLTCGPGFYAPQGATGPCVPCAAGTTDDDSYAATSCVACGVGVYTDTGSTRECAFHSCLVGYIDDDSNATTPCVECGRGHYVPSGQHGLCAPFLCAPGETDIDGSATTVCVSCAAGSYSGPGSSGVCTQCLAGFTDDDENPATPCVECGAGTYVDAGASGNCLLFNCTAGTIDDDSNASTPCGVCGTDHYVPEGQNGSCADYVCTAGTEDSDHLASTPCVPVASAVKSVDSGSSSTTYAVAGALSALVVVVLVGLFFLWRARRARNLEKNRPFSFESTLMELHNRGLGDTTVDGKPREMKRIAIKLLNNIGEGAFGTVSKGLVDERGTTGVPEYTVAVKVLKNEPTGSEIKEFMREAAIMAQFKHPNVLSLVGVCTAGEPAMIVLQFCEHGSLLSFLQKHTGFQQLQLTSKLSLLADVANGMEYLASCNVVHRDLAARNVLVGSDFVCKVSDFGLSRELDANSADYYASPKGMLPLRWTAPEALKTRHFATTSDVWSFGITCGEVFDDGELVRVLCCLWGVFSCRLLICFGFPLKQPYVTWENEQVWIHIQTGKAIACPVTCPAYVFDIVIAPCFNVEPALRPSFEELHQSLRSLVDPAASASVVFTGMAPLSPNSVLESFAGPSVILNSANISTNYILPSAGEAPVTTEDERQQPSFPYLSKQPLLLFNTLPQSQPQPQPQLQPQQVSFSNVEQAKESGGELQADEILFPKLDELTRSASRSSAKKLFTFANYPLVLQPNAAGIRMFQNPMYAFPPERSSAEGALLNTPVYPYEHV